MHKRQIPPLWNNHNSSQSAEKPQPTVQYVRDSRGQLKYVVTIDLSEFIPSDIHVRFENDVVIVEAEHQRQIGAGVLDTHELKYKVSLPTTVILSTVRHTIDAKSIFRLEGSVKEAIRPNFTGKPNRQQSLNFPRNLANVNNPGFVNRQQDNRTLHQRAPTPTRDKRVSFLDVEVRPADVTKNQPRWGGLQGPLSPPLPPRTDTTDPQNNLVRQRDKPRQRAGGRAQAPGKVFNLRVAIGAHFRAEDVSVSHTTGAVKINARRIINGLTYTHYSEHTIPGAANIDRLDSHVENGYVLVRAAFVRK